MLRYDEDRLVRALAKIPAWHRAAFAAACAERLFPSYISFRELASRRNVGALEGILKRAWDSLFVSLLDVEQTRADLAQCMLLIPDENDEPWSEEQPYAENAATAIAYTLRALDSGEAQESGWAARCAYEALDYHITHRLGIEDEEQIVAHPLVQAELARQWRDLDHLRVTSDDVGNAFAQLRDRARSEAAVFFGAFAGLKTR